MLFEKIGTGNSISEAFENAKLQLSAPEDAELHQEIIQDAKKKLFGLRTEPAKVRVWYETKDAPVKEVKQSAPAPAAEKKPVEKKTAPEKPAAPAKKAASEKKPAPAKPAVKAVEEEKLVEIEIADNDKAVAFLRNIINGMGISDFSISLAKNETDNEYIYTVDCKNEDGTVIGRRGETLDAIQYLLRLSMNKGLAEDKNRKVSVNIGNYREKRNDNLRALAQKNARNVLKYGRNAVLEPMNPYERRIIHTTVQGIEGVTSYSTGVDANRRVIISLEEGVQPTNPGKGGYNRGGGRGGYNNRGGRNGGNRGGYQKREPYQPSTTRAPRKDTAGSLYGKIDISSDGDK